MKISIMQPYFFPYIGYFQLMNAVDEFVVYDNIEYTKKGWINRNRLLANGKISYISLPLRKDSDFLDIRDRWLAEIWPLQKKKMLNTIVESYRKAPSFDRVFPLMEKCILVDEMNLFQFILKSLVVIGEYLEIKAPFVVSSTIPIDHSLKANKKVIEICKARSANGYLNPIGGTELYTKDEFEQDGIALSFLKPILQPYAQSTPEFNPALSIVDVIMNCSKERAIEMLSDYELV